MFLCGGGKKGGSICLALNGWQAQILLYTSHILISYLFSHPHANRGGNERQVICLGSHGSKSSSWELALDMTPMGILDKYGHIMSMNTYGIC